MKSSLLRIIGVVLWMQMLGCYGSTDPTRNDTCPETGAPPPNRVSTTERVTKLREKMITAGIDALIIPTDDEHQNEYVAAADKKRSFITGFSGSAGTAVVTSNKQAVWTDGRYFDQAASELDCNWWLMRSGNPGVKSLTEWIKDVLPAGSKVGADAKVTSTSSWKAYEKIFSKAGLNMVQVADLVGQVWNETGSRPQASNNEVDPLALEYSGRSWQDKVNDIRQKLDKADTDAVVVSALDEVAWLFNLRGSDIAYNPVFFAYAIVEKDRSTNPKLYLRAKSNRLSNPVQQHLKCDSTGECTSGDSCVRVYDYVELDGFITSQISSQNKSIWISSRTNYHIYSLVTNKLNIVDTPSPLLLPKAIKNEVERQGMRNAHLRDSAVIAEFITRLEKELDEGISWDEMKVAQEIDDMRRNQPLNKGLSFNTIAGSGKNGAIIHYSPANSTNQPVNKTAMLLLDSGGQYLDGTTDITRTFHFGTPTPFQKEAYTLVLLGVIDLAMMKFPSNITLGSSLDVEARKALWDVGLDYKHGTGHGIGMFLFIHEGSSIDALARRPMWRYGLNFGHGTGHGIGMYLNVHEGPARISPRRQSSSVSSERPIYDGMFFSDEPGYYNVTAGFGVRLETIVMATYTSTQYGSSNSYLTFEAIALIPFEKKLIVLEMLNKEQRIWLNEYHSECRKKTGEYLKANGKTDAYNWLLERTEPVPLEDDTNDDTNGDNKLHAPYLVIAIVISMLCFAM